MAFKQDISHAPSINNVKMTSSVTLPQSQRQKSDVTEAHALVLMTSVLQLSPATKLLAHITGELDHGVL